MLYKSITVFILSLVSVVVMRAERPSNWRHAYSLTISPIQLIEPIVRMNLEFRTGEDHGVGVFGEVGDVNGVFAWGLGGQFMYYAIGDFEHGMQIGGLMQYVHVSDSNDDVSLSVRGLSLSAVLGYKYAAPFGLTLFVNAGPGVLIAGATASSGSESASGTATGFFLYGDFGIGWSF